MFGLVGALYYLDIPKLFRQRFKNRKVEPRCFSVEEKPSLSAFAALTSQRTFEETYPLASRIEKNIPIYESKGFDLSDRDFVDQLQDEFHHILLHGPGVLVIQNFFSDRSVIDATNAAYDAIIQSEAEGDGKRAEGDHYAPAGANARIWNSFSKHALHDPSSFSMYHSNPLFPIICESYLGPAYRITSQVNIVHPGGAAQLPHRDYHLGFQTGEDAAKFPRAMHAASALLTLQGAVAHTDMPLESGPTRFLPFSQTFPEGFIAYRIPEFREYFQNHYVSVPLTKGDAVFFSPALFHAAGANQMATCSRSANLLQVSSAMGKTMETIDSQPVIDVCWDFLLSKYRDHQGLSAEVEALIKAIAEGYPFPTNLDRRPPAPGRMAPASEQDMLFRGLSESWARERLMDELKKMGRASAA
ncbi:hypothetical protein M433DRAFT_76969 [Acidomyces richmondensis BFW]|nr:MAG: hypothetical protein FE78DRAFT_144009 [Acidomyces sp. 'richmondensis']KYG40926.1 hypothetical protein M433DRAFT_76969 [Acidomyces richmondensis BFW]